MVMMTQPVIPVTRRQAQGERDNQVHAFCDSLFR
jgi:hypothetical protein